MIVLADVTRAVLGVAIGIIVALSGATVFRYILVVRAGGTEMRKASHVVKVAASHLGLLGVLGVEGLHRWGETATWRLPVGLVLITLTLSSLIDLVRYQRAEWDGIERRSMP